MDQLSSWRSHGGTQAVYRHASTMTGTPMTFSAFVPDHAPGSKLPVLWYLSGLTCTHENVTEKGEYRAACAKHGLIFIAPDTSPRGDGVPDHTSYSFGQGAGFYIDATQEPWAQHFQMRSYVERELPELAVSNFPIDVNRQGITGHSMGGHGAITVALRNPDRFVSVSAFAPVSSVIASSWGQIALSGYLGENPSNWREYDACALIEDGARIDDIRVDQGGSDSFLAEQLKTPMLVAACENAGIRHTVRMRS